MMWLLIHLWLLLELYYCGKTGLANVGSSAQKADGEWSEGFCTVAANTLFAALPGTGCSLFYQLSLFLQSYRPDDDYASGRRTRISQLCTYFQQKYKHLCRLERAESQQRKCQHTFRKALLRAANREPEYAGQLIRELRRASCPWTRWGTFPYNCSNLILGKCKMVF